MSQHTEYFEYFDYTTDLDVPKRYNKCPLCGLTDPNAGVMVWRKTNGWGIYCHYCHTYKFIGHDGIAPPSAIISRVNGIRRPANKNGRVIYLPEDFTLSIPACAKSWLRRYGVTESEITDHAFGYSPRMNRLIMPVFKGDKLVFWQGRGFGTGKNVPKYISMKSSTGGEFFELLRTVEGGWRDTCCVLVEDIVSAICLRRAGYSAISLLGSYIGDKISSRLQALGINRVCIWLDPDKRKEAIQFSKKLSGLGFSAACLLTPTKDPKDYNTSQIRNYLSKGGFPYEEVQETGKEKAASPTEQQETLQDSGRT